MSSSSQWSTAIAAVESDEVVIRGYELSELVGEIGYTDAVFLVLCGELPDDGKRRMLDAIFVSLIEHGISPSTIITRMLTSCGTPLQAAVAGGVLSIADWHGGSGEQLAELLAGIVAEAPEEEAERSRYLADRAAEVVGEYRGRKQRFEGFGHPQHSDGDPRALTLFRIAERTGTTGPHTELLRGIEKAIEEQRGKRLPINVTGAIASILLDLGFSWRAIRGMVIAPRSTGLVAHVVEELEQGGKWRHADADDVEYTGPTGRKLGRDDGDGDGDGS